MSIDLTGGAVTQFLLGELRPVISRHHRFRDNDGSALTSFSNLILYKDVSMLIGNLRSDGNQHSPDNFMATLMGRAVAAPISGSQGAFLEWLQEIDTTGATPAPGVYYLSIDTVNNETRAVRGILEVNRWVSGSVYPGQGSKVYVDPRIPIEEVTPQDSAVEFRTGIGYLTILTYTEHLVLARNGVPLVPGLDWWIQVWQETVIVQSTSGGGHGCIPIPPGFLSFVVVDQDDYELREDKDWFWGPDGTITLAAWTTEGNTLKVRGFWRADPSTTSYVNPENILHIAKTSTETLVPNQGSAYTLQRGDYAGTDLVWNHDGTVTLKNLMDIGDRLIWDLRLRQPQVYVNFHKMELNPQVIPGLVLAVGDRVDVNDSIAIIVYPDVCETYMAYGAKDGIGFDITIKSNDLATSTELGNLIRDFLRVEGRDRLESAGLTISRVSSSYQGEARDMSGTTASHSVVLSVTASADWELHRPLTNRLTYIDLSAVGIAQDVPGKPLSKVTCCGLSQFLTPYQ